MSNKNSSAYRAGHNAGKTGQSYRSHTALDGAWREARTWTEASEFHQGFSDGKSEKAAEANK